MAKRPRDPNALAAQIVAEAVGDSEPPTDNNDEEKDPAAVELGRRGGRKGGKARATKLTPKQRSDSARKAAIARWSREP